jgi:hypothetical protein
MQSEILMQELSEIRAQIARLQEREARLHATLRGGRYRADRPGWPIQRVEGTGEHGSLRT